MGVGGYIKGKKEESRAKANVQTTVFSEGNTRVGILKS